MRINVLLCALAVAALSACGSLPGSSSPDAGGASQGAPARTLASEQSRLRDALNGTPVTVEITEEGPLRVRVPPEFAFDAGRAVVKPPLAAVLDRVAIGLKPPSTFPVRINAPADAKGAGGTLMAQDRAASVRDYLIARGVLPTRFGPLGRADTVELSIGRPTSP